MIVDVFNVFTHLVDVLDVCNIDLADALDEKFLTPILEHLLFLNH